MTDLSGFTRLTKKHGILHFLSVFGRAIRLASPHIADNKGTLLKTAADNMIAVFPDRKDALAAAKSPADLEEVKRQLKEPVLFDGRNIFQPARLRRIGFTYYGIGTR